MAKSPVYRWNFPIEMRKSVAVCYRDPRRPVILPEGIFLHRQPSVFRWRPDLGTAGLQVCQLKKLQLSVRRLFETNTLW